VVFPPAWSQASRLEPGKNRAGRSAIEDCWRPLLRQEAAAQDKDSRRQFARRRIPAAKHCPREGRSRAPASAFALKKQNQARAKKKRIKK